MKLTKTCNCCGRNYVDSEDFLNNTSRWRMCDKGMLYFNCSCKSTMVLPKGSYSWYTPNLIMRPEALSLFNLLQAKAKLPYIPHHVLEMQRVLSEKNSSLQELSAIADKDPLLAREILAIANAAKLDPDAKISSLEHAIAYIGNDTLSEIVLLAAIKACSLNTYYYTSKVFWEESFLVGVLAEQIVKQHAKHLEPYKAFLGGVFCNLGKFVAAFYIPELTDSIHLELQRTRAERLTWQDAEKIKGAPSHCLLGEIGAALWGLPEYVCDANAHHHSLQHLQSAETDGPPSLGEIIALSNQLSHIAEHRAFRQDCELYSTIVHRLKGNFLDTELLLKDYPALKKRASLPLS